MPSNDTVGVLRAALKVREVALAVGPSEHEGRAACAAEVAALRAAIADVERLTALESFVRAETGLVLHTGFHGGGKYAGLEIKRRTLREALDCCFAYTPHIDAAMQEVPRGHD
jgi:hypothetical protein